MRLRAPSPPLALALLALPLHLALAALTELSPDEAYYLAIARRSPLLLVDHPPLLPSLLALTDRLRFLPLEIRTRLVPMACAFAATLLVAKLAASRGAKERGVLLASALATFALLPTIGGFVATPDGPFLVATLAAALVTSPIALGVAVLVGMSAKVAMAPLALALALDPRRDVRSKIAIVLGLVASLPLALPSLRFQLHHAFADRSPTGWSASAAIGALFVIPIVQALLWSPWPLARIVSFARVGSIGDRLLVGVLPLLVVVSTLARARAPEANWLAPAMLLLLAFVAHDADRPRRGRPWAFILAATTTAIAALHAVHPFLPLPTSIDPTARLHGWREDSPPSDAPGIGDYALPAERCVYRDDCTDFDLWLRSR